MGILEEGEQGWPVMTTSFSLGWAGCHFAFFIWSGPAVFFMNNLFTPLAFSSNRFRS